MNKTVRATLIAILLGMAAGAIFAIVPAAFAKDAVGPVYCSVKKSKQSCKEAVLSSSIKARGHIRYYHPVSNSQRLKVFSLVAEGMFVLTGVVNFVLGAKRKDLVLSCWFVNANARMAIGLAVLAIGLTIPGATVWLYGWLTASEGGLFP